MKTLLSLPVLLGSVAIHVCCAAATPSRPNIIFILGDDVGLGNVTCYGADFFRTPRIDQLARSGLRFTHAYATPSCGPTRASLMTGRYPFRLGATDNNLLRRINPADHVFIPAVLKPAGYVSSVVGKWDQFPPPPAKFGFDDYFTFNGSGIYWYAQGDGETYHRNGATFRLYEGQYIPDMMHAHLIDFVTRHRAQPFFVYYSMSQMHDRFYRTPDSAPDTRDIYKDNNDYMDKLIGRLVDDLERLQLRENTILIFMGDNGTDNIEFDRATIGGRRLSGAKGFMLEGGIRVPLLVSWPGRIPAGGVTSTLVDAADIFPTILEFAGVKPPPGLLLDGLSFAGLLRGTPGKSRPWVFTQYRNEWAFCEHRWKLNQAGELFDLSDGPFVEKPVPRESADPAAPGARRRLEAAAASLNLRPSPPGVGSDPSREAAPKIAVAAMAVPDVAAVDRERILRAAKEALSLEPITITRYRAKLSEGGPNDFYSNGDYWWPNPKTPDGLPYVQRDGETNPQNFVEHRRCVMGLRDAVAALAAAFKLTGEEQYAAKAAGLLKVFFLDLATRMNPSLNYAQAIPGVSSGRGIGIIDTLHLIEVPLAIQALQRSKAFTPELVAGLKQWFRDYVYWMTTSKNGREEANHPNNHSVAFWLQVAAFSSLTGDEAQLAECRRRFRDVFLEEQMSPTGVFPKELRRTKPYGYSIFQLDNLATLAHLLSRPGDDLWRHRLFDGRSMSRTMEIYFPYLKNKTKWKWAKDIQSWESWPARQPCLLFAGLALKEQTYLDLWSRLPPDPTDAEVVRNIAITQPLLWLK